MLKPCREGMLKPCREGISNRCRRDIAGEIRSWPKRKHLYLVVDDRANGFSIHKIDTDALKRDDAQGLKPRFPGDAALRVEAPDASFLYFAAAESEVFIMATDEHSPILVFDAQTRRLSAGPCRPAQLSRGFYMAVAVGGMVYVLTSDYVDFKWQYIFMVMSACPDEESGRRDDPSKDWSWESVPSPPPFIGKEYVISYAVHPDEHTIFMTTRRCTGRRYQHEKKGTYSFDTKLCMWRWHGEWALPFQGRGYFNSDLDAWVGLHEDGYICSCKVPTRGATPTDVLQPGWLMGKEKLFRKDPSRHMAATLACMGNNEFCLVESVVREGLRLGSPGMLGNALGEHEGCVIHLTIFSLECNEKGELQTAVDSTTHSYRVSLFSDLFPLQAFWM